MIAEIKRLSEIATVSTWALFGAAVMLTVLHIAVVLLLWLGTLPPAKWLGPGDTIGIISVMLAFDLMAVIFALAKARVAAKGPGALSLDLSSGGTDAPPSVTKITTEVTKS